MKLVSRLLGGLIASAPTLALAVLGWEWIGVLGVLLAYFVGNAINELITGPVAAHWARRAGRDLEAEAVESVRRWAA